MRTLLDIEVFYPHFEISLEDYDTRREERLSSK